MSGRLGNKGIFLTEVMVSLCILSFVILTSIPALSHVYKERLVLRQKTEALRILRYQLVQWKADQQMTPYDPNDSKFILNWEKKTDHSAILSISWSIGERHFTMHSEARK
ncbi:type II secretion system protein [Sporolactobacillus shoreae]|nr:type II secretion system protein [Sporolactobacillus shoreae]